MVSIKSSLSLLVLEVDMFKWFKRLLHLHDWIILEKYTLKITDDYGGTKHKGLRYIMQCKTCGHITKRDMI